MSQGGSDIGLSDSSGYLQGKEIIYKLDLKMFILCFLLGF